MNKHIFGISTYFLTFFVSVTLVALLGVKKEEAAVEVFSLSVNAPISRSYETVDQREIRKLLENDRRVGFEYYGRAEQPEAAEELVENMRELNSSQLPPQIRKAYANHLEAWNEYANHVNSRAHLTESDRLCPQLDAEISKTYDELLDTAKDFGVVFPH